MIWDHILLSYPFVAFGINVLLYDTNQMYRIKHT